MANDRRPDDMVRITTKELAQAFIDEQIALGGKAKERAELAVSKGFV